MESTVAVSFNGQMYSLSGPAHLAIRWLLFDDTFQNRDQVRDRYEPTSFWTSGSSCNCYVICTILLGNTIRDYKYNLPSEHGAAKHHRRQTVPNAYFTHSTAGSVSLVYT